MFDLNTMREQVAVMQCPYCFERKFTMENTIG